jgi:NitT/TauT family transport system substrate-binding protein
MLQAYCRKRGLDIATAARPVFGAPPLLAGMLEQGKLDAALLFWTFNARLEAKGFRPLEQVAAIEQDLGLAAPVAMLGYLMRETLAADRPRAAALAAASADAKALLANSDEAWSAIRPLLQAEEDATATKLRAAFVAGIPHRPLGEEQADAARLVEALVRLGGERLVGPVSHLPDDLYWDSAP